MHSRNEGQKKKKKSKGKRNTASKRIDCPFQAVAKLIDDKWTLVRINNAKHNDEDGGQSTHAAIRRFFKTPKVVAVIKGQYVAGDAPKNILTYIHDNYGNGDPDNLIISFKDVYNIVNDLRAERLGNKTPIQALDIQLQNNPDKYWARVQLNPITHEVEYLFWINKVSMDTLRDNGEVIIFDCTYKTNRHGMPFAILTGVTSLNTSFYSGMSFLKGETTEDYEWLIRTIKDLFKELDIPLPIVWLSDGDLQIATGLHK